MLGPQLYVRNFIGDSATTPATNTTTQTTSPRNDEMSIRMACGDVVMSLAESRIAEIAPEGALPTKGMRCEATFPSALQRSAREAPIHEPPFIAAL